MNKRARRYFENTISLVTGGASGIGRALSQQLGAAGSHVVVTDIDGLGAQRVCDAICASGGRAEAHHHDVRDHDGWDRLVGGVIRDHGRLDSLFNNAGVGVGGEVRHLSDEDWRNIVDVNLWGVIHGSRVAVRHMVPRGTGHIINVASMSGLFPVPMTTAYATTKHAVVGLSTCLRAELADLGVAVTVVCPGLTDTAIWQVSPIRSADRKRLLDALPFRYESAERVAAAILEGAARRRAMVVVPAHARLLWWLNRAAPGPTLEVLRLIVRRLRSVAATSGDAIFSAPRNGGET